MSRSKLDSKCEKCKYKNECDNKKMVAYCMLEYFKYEPMANQPITHQNTISINLDVNQELEEYLQNEAKKTRECKGEIKTWIIKKV